MPRIRGEAACRTCQKRKVRCDEKLPVCGNCLRAKRYCDHTRHVHFRHCNARQSATKTHDEVLEPKEALKDAMTSRLFAHYVKHLACEYQGTAAPNMLNSLISYVQPGMISAMEQCTSPSRSRKMPSKGLCYSTPSLHSQPFIYLPRLRPP